MNPRVVALVAGVLGLITIVVALAFSQLPQVRAATDATCWRSGAVVEFELAKDRADLGRLFDTPPACRDVAVTAMDASNRLDVAAFIPAYTASNLAAILFLAGGFRRAPAAAAAVAAVAALAADYVETLTLLRITQDLDANGGLIAISTPAAWTKFALLGAHGLLLATICFRSTPRRPILGAALVLPTLATAVLAFDPANQTPFVAAALLAWGSVTVVALWKGVRG